MTFTRRRSRWTWLILGLVAAGNIGCRDSDPPRPHYRDVGTGGTVLLPVPPPKYVITDPNAGTADWHPFRDPSEEPPEPEAVDEDEESGGEASTEEIEAEIRELIADYNAIAADKDIEELLGYHLEEQQEALKPVLEAGFALLEKLPELASALEAKLPDRADRIAEVLAQLGDPGGDVLSVESLTVDDDTTVTAKLSGGVVGSSCRFVLIEDEWFVEMPDAVDYAVMKTVLEAARAGCDGWLAGLSSGEASAEEVLTQIETLEKTLGR